ncbi:MAG: hypothetical protein K2H30_05280, partial [Clostridia bacterium]|nr:hypothetical protein [Clostridia bacterium]
QARNDFQIPPRSVYKRRAFSNESPILYICSECGYMHTSTKAWDVCPLCKASQGEVELHIPFQKEKI